MITKFINAPNDYLVGIVFSAGGKELKLASNEKPKSEFYSRMADVVFAAAPLFSYPAGDYTMKSIQFASAGTRLLLEVDTNEGTARLSLPIADSKPLVKRRHVGDQVIEEYDAEHPQNIYNEAVKAFVEEIESYIHGERLQMSLEFVEEIQDLAASGELVVSR